MKITNASFLHDIAMLLKTNQKTKRNPNKPTNQKNPTQNNQNPKQTNKTNKNPQPKIQL